MPAQSLLFVTPWTVALQTPLSMRILVGVAIPLSRRSSQPSVESRSALQEDSLPSEPPGKPLVRSPGICILETKYSLIIFFKNAS